jgi:hypothetical protein
VTLSGRLGRPFQLRPRFGQHALKTCPLLILAFTLRNAAVYFAGFAAATDSSLAVAAGGMTTVVVLMFFTSVESVRSR